MVQAREGGSAKMKGKQGRGCEGEFWRFLGGAPGVCVAAEVGVWVGDGGRWWSAMGVVLAENYAETRGCPQMITTQGQIRQR